jgi:hypothetical protein
VLAPGKQARIRIDVAIVTLSRIGHDGWSGKGGR